MTDDSTHIQAKTPQPNPALIPLRDWWAMWEQIHGERVSRWTMSRAIEKLGWTRIKSRCGHRSAMRKS